MSKFDLPIDRLTTTDETGARVYVYPADASGAWRRRRDWFYAVALGAYFGLPWVRVGGRPPFLFDIPHRRFEILGTTFWAHDGPLFIFVAAGFAIALFAVTSVLGRVWCGWSCPQTLFVDGLFRRLERLAEGDAATRRRRDQGPWTVEKILRRAAKWALFSAAALAVALTFLAYFIGTDDLAGVVRSWPGDNTGSFAAFLISMGVVLFDFGWFREQFCTIACPYGRFQSVLMDDRSMIVGYDAARGEPRAGAQAGREGDCVNCYRCVQVCPTGIDIRRGVQMECIACTSCIDACDEVMTRLQRPKGLIRYTSLAELAGRPWSHWNWRTAAYALALGIYMSALGWRLHARRDLFFEVVRAVGAPYLQGVAADGRGVVVNHYDLDLSDQSNEDLRVDIGGAPGGDSRITYSAPASPLILKPGTTVRTDLFATFPRDALRGGRLAGAVRLDSRRLGSGRGDSQQEVLELVGPF